MNPNPPTPTIEEQLETVLHQWLVHDENCEYSLFDSECTCIAKDVKRNLNRELSLLITKARIDEGAALWERIVPTVTNLDDTEYNAIKDAIYTRRQELKATTQKADQ